jgi:phenylacetate-CoA ligase
MDLRALLARQIFVPFYERRWGVRPGELQADLQRSQYEASDVLRDRQWSAVQALIAHCQESVPFYREKFAKLGVDAEEIRSWRDFQSLPLLQKEDLRERGGDLLRDGATRETLFHKRTGGSTGVPVHVYWDATAHRFKRALVKRHDAWVGYELGTKLAALWGDTDRAYPLKTRLFKRLCERTIYLDTLKMDEAYLAAFVERLRAYRPSILMGHAHSLAFFTEFLLSSSADDIQFSGIISTAETLAAGERELIESRFGKVLFDRYGCEELSLIASECESHDGLHIASEGVYVEILGGDENTPGRVVVTDLVNRGMPLLRYEVGDLATVARGECPCGRGLPRLRRVFGRTSDILFAPDGRKISGVSILDTFMIHIPGVRQAQIVQDLIDHITIRVVEDMDFGEASRRRLRETVAKVFGPAMRHDVVTVDAIAPTARGKFQFTICEIDPDRPADSAR